MSVFGAKLGSIARQIRVIVGVVVYGALAAARSAVGLLLGAMLSFWMISSVSFCVTSDAYDRFAHQARDGIAPCRFMASELLLAASSSQRIHFGINGKACSRMLFLRA